MFGKQEGKTALGGKIAVLAMALLTSGMLAGCTSDDPAQDQALDPGMTTGAAWQQLKSVDALEIALKESGEGINICIPQFVVDEDDVTADAFNGFNEDLQSKMTEWQAWLDNPAEGETASVNTYAMDTENYLSVLVTEQLADAENTENEVSSYVFDKIVEREMDLDMAMTLANVDDDMIAAALEEYISANSDGANEEWLRFSVDAYAMDENEQAVLYIDTTVVKKDDDGNKERRKEIYVLSGGEIIGRLAM
ncbi:MAG: hypothetical protein IJB55_04770 [Firmicutes bacterium]|nr:hypothetical protein [Bacillota bacterium]